MVLNKSILRKVFIVALGMWFVFLLAVYIPISNLVTPTFPLTINNHILTFFAASTGLAFSLAFYLGLNELIEVELPRIRQ